ncbi:PKD domain-containing protein [Parasediminibacterium sp. JCM 36343]|uniref:DUF7948 domain-containing protein n=1 Tax=Parasediminibacterium sp. JCM 36343 TaxID=3374279 RepID=UPI00397D28C5
MEQNIIIQYIIFPLSQFFKKQQWLLFVGFFSLLAHTDILAQQNLEFVENKGQWDKNIAFKGEMSTGAFVLKPDGGYRVMLYSQQSLDHMNQQIHPYENAAQASTLRNAQDLTKASIVAQAKLPIPANDISFSMQGHVYEIKFLNSNPHPQALPDKPLDSYNNYLIGTDSTKWAGNCRIFNAVTFKNIYPNIDIRYYTDRGNLKYDFIVNPGGDASNIVAYIDGADALSVSKGQLAVKTSVGEIKESIPYSYQFSTKTGKKEVECSYKLNGNIVHFDVKDAIAKDATLIIDPQFIFCSFSGSKSSNWGYTATYDAGGNFYAGGIVFGDGFPVSNGAFQTGYAGGDDGTGEGGGGFDIGIMKFNSFGTKRIYATYLGGSRNEYPHSMVVDNDFNLIVAGKTTSANFPLYPLNIGHYGPPNGDGNFDIYITKLNAAGTGLVGSRVIGGSGNDGVNIRNKYPVSGDNSGVISLRLNYGDDSRSEVIIDSLGNIYLASCTQSTDFLVTPNAIQTTPSQPTNGRYQDAVVIKTSPDLQNILFSTFLGGSGDDAAYVLAINPINGELAVAGGTASRDFPGNYGTDTLFNRFQGGVCDGFLTIMANDGSRILRSAYLGTPSTDMVFGVQYDKYGFPYIMGTTFGNWRTTGNVQFKQAGGKQFIAKLQPDLNGFIYSTTFGTANSFAPNISPTAFLVDRCENVYVSGWGGKGNSGFDGQGPQYPSSGTVGLSVTRNASQPKTDGSDFYFFVLERNANSQLYGSFFGQNGGNYPDHVDGGTSRFDKEGVIYQSVCANCGGPVGIFPTSPTSAYPNNGSGTGCNLAAIKIAFNLAGIGAAVKSSIKGVPGKKFGCVPLTVIFTDTLAEGKTYQWNFGDGPGFVSTNQPTITHTYNAVGSYVATLISKDPTTCNAADTSQVTIKVGNNEATLGFTAEKFNDGTGCKSTTYEFTNTSTAGTPFQSNSFTVYYGDGSQDFLSPGTPIRHKYLAPGTYKASLVLTDQTYCNAPDSVGVIVRIADKLQAIIQADSIGCAPFDAVFTNASKGGETFTWDFGDKSPQYTGSDLTVTHHFATAGTFVIQLFAFDNSTCNKTDTFKFTLITKPKPFASFSYSPNPPKSNEPVTFTNESTGAIKYEWTFDDGDTLITTKYSDPPPHLFNASRYYRITLTAFNDGGCFADTVQTLRAIVKPLVDVANAIAPSSTGNNRIVQVRGFGIEKMHWKIYNRWGQLIFETSNKTAVWDGRFKGQIQAPDVYSYTLEITYSDGTTYSKTGDITLIK